MGHIASPVRADEAKVRDIFSEMRMEATMEEFMAFVGLILDERDRCADLAACSDKDCTSCIRCEIAKDILGGPTE